MDLSNRAVGIAQILLSGVCFGFLGIFGKTAFARGLEASELLSLRYIVAGVLVLASLTVIKPARVRFSRSQMLLAIALGGIGHAAFSLFFFKALEGLSASLSVLILYIYPVLVSIGAWIFLGEKIPREKWFVLPMAMIGLVLLIAGELYVKHMVALFYGVASAVLYSVYVLCSSRWLAKADVVAMTALMQIAAGLVLGAIAWHGAERLREVIAVNWLLIVAMAVICSVLAMTLFQLGLQKLRNWEASVLSTAEPVTGILIAFVFLGERLSFAQIGGAVLVIGAFISLSLPSRRIANA